MRWLTAIGLIIDILGVCIIFWGSKKTKSPNLSDAYRYSEFKKKVNWGLGLVVMGFLFQLIGAIWSK